MRGQCDTALIKNFNGIARNSLGEHRAEITLANSGHYQGEWRAWKHEAEADLDKLNARLFPKVGTGISPALQDNIKEALAAL